MKQLKIFPTIMLPACKNILTGRFALTLNDEKTNKNFGFTVQNHKEKVKSSIVHDTCISRQYSIKLFVGLPLTFQFQTFSMDATQANPQSSKKFSIDIYIRPPSDLSLKTHLVLRFLKPFYGLAESDDYWEHTFRNHLETSLEIKTIVFNPLFYFKRFGSTLIGLCAAYVNDMLHAKIKSYSIECHKTENILRWKARE